MQRDDQRVVAERYVDEGETVSANTPLLKIVTLHPITAVIFVTEKEYAGLRTEQRVELVTDAYQERSFSGVIRRIAPVFREATRQARIDHLPPIKQDHAIWPQPGQSPAAFAIPGDGDGCPAGWVWQRPVSAGQRRPGRPSSHPKSKRRDRG